MLTACCCIWTCGNRGSSELADAGPAPNIEDDQAAPAIGAGGGGGGAKLDELLEAPNKDPVAWAERPLVGEAILARGAIPPLALIVAPQGVAENILAPPGADGMPNALDDEPRYSDFMRAPTTYTESTFSQKDESGTEQVPCEPGPAPLPTCLHLPKKRRWQLLEHLGHRHHPLAASVERHMMNARSCPWRV